LSEFGCNTNTRKFEEIASLYSTDMTSVYSGGLVYEYSQEAANYGLVDLSGSSPSELPDFTALQTAYKNTPNPSGDGGYKTSNPVSNCPSPAANWAVSASLLPIMPAGAQKYFTSGAGAGPGNSGSTGSQNAGTASTGMTGSGTSSSSGSASSGSASPSKGAAASMRAPDFSIAPFVCAAVVVVSSLVGGAGMLL
jgi:hypothetical protein